MNDSDVREIIGSTAYGSDNEKIGTVGQVFFDDSTGQPEWVTVNTGLFGTSESFAPLASARVADGGVYLAHTKDAVKDAPNVDLDGGPRPPTRSGVSTTTTASPTARPTRPPTPSATPTPRRPVPRGPAPTTR
jgi:hypothetical protein